MVRVLIVDDEPLLGEELQDALELEGFDADYASSASDGLSLRAEQKFDLIITDLKMPGISGLEFLACLADRGETAPIVVMSGHGAEVNRTRAMELGAKACFSKPFDVDDFISELHQILR